MRYTTRIGRVIARLDTEIAGVFSEKQVLDARIASLREAKMFLKDELDDYQLSKTKQRSAKW